MQRMNDKWRPLGLLLMTFGAAALGCAADPAPGGANPGSPAAAASAPVAAGGAASGQPAFTPPGPEALARQDLYVRKVQQLQPSIAHLPADKQQQIRAELKRSILEK